MNSGLADAAGIDDGGGDVRPPQRLRHIELKSGKKLHFDRKNAFLELFSTWACLKILKQKFLKEFPSEGWCPKGSKVIKWF